MGPILTDLEDPWGVLVMHQVGIQVLAGTPVSVGMQDLVGIRVSVQVSI